MLDAIEIVVASEEKDGLVLDSPLDRVNFKYEIQDAIRQAVVGRALRITNLTDEVLRGEIDTAARRRILELVPEG